MLLPTLDSTCGKPSSFIDILFFKKICHPKCNINSPLFFYLLPWLCHFFGDVQFYLLLRSFCFSHVWQEDVHVPGVFSNNPGYTGEQWYFSFDLFVCIFDVFFLYGGYHHTRTIACWSSKVLIIKLQDATCLQSWIRSGIFLRCEKAVYIPMMYSYFH